MSEEEKEYRLTVLKVGAASIGFCLLVAYWYATQGVAADSNYSELLGSSIFDSHIYPPWKFYLWQHNNVLYNEFKKSIDYYDAFIMLGFIVGAGFTYLVTKDMKKVISHGSASFATSKDIEKAGLGELEETGETEKKKFLGIIPYEKKVKKAKNSGVVVGINPYTHKLMLHNGVEHILLMAPTRSGNLRGRRAPACFAGHSPRKADRAARPRTASPRLRSRQEAF